MPGIRTWVLEKKKCFHIKCPASTLLGHRARAPCLIGNGDEMLVKDSPSSLVVRSQILQKILRYAIYRDLMNKGSLPRGFVEHRLNFVEKKV